VAELVGEVGKGCLDDGDDEAGEEVLPGEYGHETHVGEGGEGHGARKRIQHPVHKLNQEGQDELDEGDVFVLPDAHIGAGFDDRGDREDE